MASFIPTESVLGGKIVGGSPGVLHAKKPGSNRIKKRNRKRY